MPNLADDDPHQDAQDRPSEEQSSCEPNHPDQDPGNSKVDRDADDLASYFYSKLRRIAAQQMNKERRNHTLTPTALVHEAYIRLQHSKKNNTAEFLRNSRRVMQQILIDHARKRGRLKRGGDRSRIPLEVDSIEALHVDKGVEYTNMVKVRIKDALEKLHRELPHVFPVMDLRFNDELSFPQISSRLGISTKIARQQFELAFTYLITELDDG